MEQKQQDFTIWYFILALIIMLTMQTFLLTPRLETITYSQFKSLIKKGLVTDLGSFQQKTATS